MLWSPRFVRIFGKFTKGMGKIWDGLLMEKAFNFVVSVNSVYLDFVGVGGGCSWSVTFDN